MDNNNALQDGEVTLAHAILDNDIPALTENSGYKHSPRCTICTARHPVTGEILRPEIEKVTMVSGSKQAQHYLKSIGINLSLRAIQRHVQNHAPYLSGGLFLRKQKKFIQEAIDTHKDAETTLQNIINIGAAMVEDGSLPVTEKMFLEAMKLHNRNASERRGRIDDFFDEIEGTRFMEGVIVDDDGEPEAITSLIPEEKPKQKEGETNNDEHSDD